VKKTVFLISGEIQDFFHKLPEAIIFFAPAYSSALFVIFSTYKIAHYSIL